ncbi:long-chain-fatty-acid--CoA ligase [Heyndrickxia acidicola]|uniref:Long-chain-fatty-acid--CoA ligase n=1 Tax=Heyndrickxia acidicola TaxID=209389 RepID=A0ABU6MAQ8_9BACI|nr:long-chain-fatty-acid--CoA ligase [Heyndrickxia acidicola]MED1201739.1 long-chain-fatty-acid--CoA ligase [Heyndrickxia acidicola]
MGLTISHLFEQTVLKYPDREALVDCRNSKRWTYKAFQEDIHKTANAFLRRGIQKGDKVSTILYNTSELAIILFACAKIGAVFNPINFRLKSAEIAYIFKDAQPKIVIFEKAAAEQVAEARKQYECGAEFWSIDNELTDYAYCYSEILSSEHTNLEDINIKEDDVYAIMYTSGTTGRPKGVMHRHFEMVEQALICSSILKLGPLDRGLVCAPMFHCAELHCSFLPRILVGACNIILHEFQAHQVLQTIEKEKITTFFSAPTMWNMLLQEDFLSYNLFSLRIGLYGAAPMAPVLVNKVKDAFEIELVQAYGQTEMGPAVSFLLDHEQLIKAGSAGRACYGHDIRVVRKGENNPSEPEDILPPFSIGEILTKGPCMMAGYYQLKEATERAMYKGWYHTGDLGYMDDEGYLYISDRADDMIISGGENIYPREVEDILFEHEGILEAAVFGLPHEHWGEQVAAAIVKKKPLTEQDIEQFCKESPKLADYKRPRRYFFLKELPKNASGKVQKFILREQFK